MPCYPAPVFQHNGTWSVDGINGPVVKNGIMPLLKKVGEQRNLTLIDLHTFLESRSDLFAGDGVHPDAGKPGADSIALMIFRTYTAAVTRVACIGDTITASDRGAACHPVKFNGLLYRAFKSAPMALARPDAGETRTRNDLRWRPLEAEGRDALGRLPRNPAEKGRQPAR
jgi:hypothetical protein